MDVKLSLTSDQRAVLERLHLPDRIEVRLRCLRLVLDVEDAETVRDALTVELAKVGFNKDYRLTADGRFIEELIDALFIP